MKNNLKKGPYIASTLDIDYVNSAPLKKEKSFFNRNNPVSKYLKSFDSFDDHIDNALSIIKGDRPTVPLTPSKKAFYKTKIKEWAKSINK